MQSDASSLLVDAELDPEMVGLEFQEKPHGSVTDRRCNHMNQGLLGKKRAIRITLGLSLAPSILKKIRQGLIPFGKKLRD